MIRWSAVKSLEQLGLPATRASVKRILLGADAEALTMSGSADLEVDGAQGALPARLYSPPGVSEPAPCLVFFHGGGFVVCDIDTHDALCRRLAHAGRIKVLSVGYRLAPEAPCPAQHLDGLAATRWVFAHARDLGVDRERIGLAGDSAGGHMALWIAPRLGAEGLHPRLLLLFYPLVEMEDAEWTGNPLPDLRGIGRLAVAYIRRILGDAEALGALTLTDMDLTATPAVILAGGGPDPVRRHGLALAERLSAAGVRVTALTYPGLVHGGLNLTHLSELPRRVISQAGEAAGDLLRA